MTEESFNEVAQIVDEILAGFGRLLELLKEDVEAWH